MGGGGAGSGAERLAPGAGLTTPAVRVVGGVAVSLGIHVATVHLVPGDTENTHISSYSSSVSQ